MGDRASRDDEASGVGAKRGAGALSGAGEGPNKHGELRAGGTCSAIVVVPRGRGGVGRERAARRGHNGRGARVRVALRLFRELKRLDSWQRLFHMARAACRGGRYQCYKKKPGPRMRIN
jgi:hypothetical protein